MKEKPLVCICIPHYNNAKTIAQTLDSIVHQTYQNIIIKIFDNVSTDESMKILREYETKYSQIQVFQNETNIGGEANFTKCIQNLEGNFGAIYHADDIYAPTIVQEQVEFLRTHPSCSCVATHGNTINESSQIIGTRPLPQKMKNSPEVVIKNQITLFQNILEYGNFITTPSVMAKVDIYKYNIQAWNGIDFKTSADLDVWIRLAGYGCFGILTTPLIHYRESTASYSYRDTRARTSENNMFLVLEYYKHFFQKQTLLSHQDLRSLEFLYFKDNANRTINAILHDKNIHLDIKIFKLSIMRTAIASKQNFKLYIIGVMTKLLQYIPLNEKAKQKLYNIRFGKKL